MSETITMPLTKFETERVLLGLYWEGDGSPFPETALVELYAKTKADGLLYRSFGSFGKNVTLAKFIAYLSTKPVVIGFDKNKNNNLIGFGYLAEVSTTKAGRKASAGYVFFKEYWGQPHIRDLCRITLRYWYNDMNIDVLYGSMLATNRLALRFATRELGFRLIGRLPKFFLTDEEMIDGIMVVQEREEFIASEGGA